MSSVYECTKYLVYEKVIIEKITTEKITFMHESRKVDYHAGGKWFINGPKRPKERQLLSLKHPCWLSLV